MRTAGIYTDMPPDEYYGDPCPPPPSGKGGSITQSGAKELLARSPAHVWQYHPRNPARIRRPAETKFDLGNVAHALLLGRGRDITVLDYDDWRSKEARAAREHALAAGKIVVLPSLYAQAKRMVEVARNSKALERWDPSQGDSEVCLIWSEEWNGSTVWCRQLVDWLSADRTHMIDYKTTGMSASPDNHVKMIMNSGWHIQAAMCDRGLAALDLELQRATFVEQETEPPNALSRCAIGPRWFEAGHYQLDKAISIWGDCCVTGNFFGYPASELEPDCPDWYLRQIGIPVDEDYERLARRAPVDLELV